MPLHRIYSAPGFFTQAEKEIIAGNITKGYVSFGVSGPALRLPAFYVVVLFLDVPTESYFVGGKTTGRFVRIVTQHLARSFQNVKQQESSLKFLESCWAPIIKSKGDDVNWELHIEEAPRELWRENGLVPPLPKTPAEKEWVRLNRAVPYDEKMNKL
ncbi:hypothetical protein HDU93_007145 [Gonapodya sp. JEL0774]|nr:hypothetical protein HDU93_007145 [Gonapodya sp. JEL0774]